MINIFLSFIVAKDSGALLSIWSIIGSMVMLGTALAGTANTKIWLWWIFCIACGPVGLMIGLGYACCCSGDDQP